MSDLEICYPLRITGVAVCERAEDVLRIDYLRITPIGQVITTHYYGVYDCNGLEKRVTDAKKPAIAWGWKINCLLGNVKGIRLMNFLEETFTPITVNLNGTTFEAKYSKGDRLVSLGDGLFVLLNMEAAIALNERISNL